MDKIFEAYQIAGADAAMKKPVEISIPNIRGSRMPGEPYEGKWDASAGNTEADIKDAIEKIIHKKVKALGLFDHMGREMKDKSRVFNDRGTFMAYV